MAKLDSPVIAGKLLYILDIPFVRGLVSGLDISFEALVGRIDRSSSRKAYTPIINRDHVQISYFNYNKLQSYFEVKLTLDGSITEASSFKGLSVQELDEQFQSKSSLYDTLFDCYIKTYAWHKVSDWLGIRIWEKTYKIYLTFKEDIEETIAIQQVLEKIYRGSNVIK